MQEPGATAGRPRRPGRGGPDPDPTPWQDPEVQWKPRDIALTFAKGPAAGLREDAMDVYGDFEAVEATRRMVSRRRPAARNDSMPTSRPALRQGSRRRGSSPTRGPRAVRGGGRWRWRRCAGWRTTFAGTRWVTRSPTWSTGTSTSPTSATRGVASAPSPSGRSIPSPTRSRWTRWRTGPRKPRIRGHGGLHPGRPPPQPPRRLLLPRPRRHQGSDPRDPHPCVQPDGDR